MTHRRDGIFLVKLLKRAVSAFRPKVEDPPPQKPVREWLRGLGHTEDEARQIEQETGDLARMMLFGLPPLERRIEEPSGSEKN